MFKIKNGADERIVFPDSDITLDSAVTCWPEALACARRLLIEDANRLIYIEYDGLLITVGRDPNWTKGLI